MAAVSGAGCASPPDQGRGIGEVATALGEPTGDFPGYEERVVLYATNRARVSPTTEGWPAYPPQPPVLWSYQLNQSSRAHSLDMRDTPCFQHPSCDGTDTFTRVLSYYTGPWSSLAENISAGTADPQTTVHDWIYEIGAAAGETGHRDAIFSKDLTLIGVGYAPGGMTPTARLKDYWTQDFVGTTIKRPRLTDGIHFPKSVAAGGKATFGATYYDAAVGTATPQVFVALDGACTGLPLARGTTALGAYEGTATLADGCHAYYFVATLGNGVALATYPDTGALQVGAGAAAATCALFTTTRPAATCAGMGGGAGAGGAAGTGAGGTTGAAGTGAAGMKGTGGAGGTAGAVGAPGAAGAPGTAGAKGTGAAGAMGAGGATGAAGTPGAGGAKGTGTAGATGGGAATGAGGATGTGGVTATGAGGQNATGTAGTPGTGAGGPSSPSGPTGAAGRAAPHGGSTQVVGSGCAVAPGPDRRVSSMLALALALAATRIRRRARA